MKKILLYTILFGAILCSSCERKPADYFIEPKAAFTLKQKEVYVYDLVDVVNQSEGQQFVLFAGDKGNNYDSINTATGANGISPNNGDNFSISYIEPGTYTISLLASGYKINENQTVVDVAQQTIVVKDTNNTITGLVFPDLYGFLRSDTTGEKSYKEYSVEASINGKYIKTEMYSPWDTNVTNSNFNPIYSPVNLEAVPEFKTSSNFTDISIQGVDNFENGKTAINLSDNKDRFIPKTVSVKSHEGETRSFELCMMQIPQFESLELDTFDIFYYDTYYDFVDNKKLYIDLEVPIEQDITSMPTSFKTFQDGTTVKINGVSQQSGTSVVDFSDPVTYTLRYEQPGYEQIFNIESQIIVRVTKK